MADNKVIKPVGFNAVKDKEILEYVKRRNFSGYVKKLIAADMLSKGKVITVKDSEPTEPIKSKSVSDKLAELKEKTSNKTAR